MTAAMVTHDEPGDHNNVMIDGLCNANKHLGGLCRNRAGKGTDHLGYGRCFIHGGSSPSGRTYGRRQAAEAAVAKLAAGTGTPVQDPIRELSRLAGEMRADYHAARQLVAQLAEDGSLVRKSFVGVDDIDPVARFWERSRDALAKVLTDMSKLGIEERQLELQQEDQRTLSAVLTAVLVDAGYDPAVVLPELGARLRAIETGGSEL